MMHTCPGACPAARKIPSCHDPACAAIAVCKICETCFNEPGVRLYTFSVAQNRQAVLTLCQCIRMPICKDFSIEHPHG